MGDGVGRCGVVGVDVLAAPHAGGAESGAHLESYGAGDAHHGVGEACVELVEEGFAGGYEVFWLGLDAAADGAAEGVAVLLCYAEEGVVVGGAADGFDLGVYGEFWCVELL